MMRLPFCAARLVPGVLALVSLTGCLSVSARVGTVGGLGAATDALNAQQGTDFSGRVATTGYGVGGEMYGILGFQGVRMTGTQTSTGTDGTAHTLRLEQADLELNLAYPMATAGPVLILPGLSLTHRTTTLGYTRQGSNALRDDGTAMVLRPHLKALTSVGDRILLSAGGGYEFAFLTDPIVAPGGGTFQSGAPGPQANVTLTVFFCSGCVGG